MKFTAKINKLNQSYPAFIEYEIYLNGSIFCHLNESDFEIFKSNFKQPIEIVEN